LMLSDPSSEIVRETDVQNMCAIRHYINVKRHRKTLRVGPSTRLASLAGSG
jgi:hypothetical protein